MITLKFSLKDFEAGKALNEMAGRMSKQEKALQEIGMYMLSSISQNFREGGRPVKWKPSKRAKIRGDLTLVDTSRLKNSITMKASDKDLKIGTGVTYAAIHNFGGDIDKNVTVKQHWRIIKKAFGKPIPERSRQIKSHTRHMKLTVPQREFLLIQDPEDWKIIHRIEQDYLLGDGLGGESGGGE